MYPAGDERVIVRETLGVILKPGQLPLEQMQLFRMWKLLNV